MPVRSGDPAPDHGRMSSSQRSAQPAGGCDSGYVLAGRKLYADDVADARTGSRQRQDQDRTSLDLRAR